MHHMNVEYGRDEHWRDFHRRTLLNAIEGFSYLLTHSENITDNQIAEYQYALKTEWAEIGALNSRF